MFFHVNTVRHKHLTGLTCRKLRPIPLPTHPGQVIGLDHQGPFQETPSGKRHIIVGVDYLTKWVEAEVVPDTSTEGILKFVENHYIFREYLLNASSVIEALVSFRNRRQTRWHYGEWNIPLPPPKHPETNGLVEWVNRTLALVLFAYVNDDHASWEDHLSVAVFAINTARQSTNEETPLELMFGRTPTQRVEALLPWPSEDPDYHEDYLQRVADLRSRVHDRICLKQWKVKEYVDRRRREGLVLIPGELVLVRRNIRKEVKTHKFLPKLVGPFQLSEMWVV